MEVWEKAMAREAWKKATARKACKKAKAKEAWKRAMAREAWKKAMAKHLRLIEAPGEAAASQVEVAAGALSHALFAPEQCGMERGLQEGQY